VGLCVVSGKWDTLFALVTTLATLLRARIAESQLED
jgi:hypothetical protein